MKRVVAFFWSAQASNKTSLSSELTIQMQQYLRINNIERKCDPLSWWKHSSASASHSHISRVAKKYLAIPRTSEWIFSKAGQVISQQTNKQKKNRLKPKHVNMFTFLQDLVEFFTYCIKKYQYCLYCAISYRYHIVLKFLVSPNTIGYFRKPIGDAQSVYNLSMIFISVSNCASILQ